MTQHSITITRTTPNCGAEVSGVDLAQPLSDEAFDTLNNALAEHVVLFFRDQEMTPEQHKTLGRRFGELHIHPTFPRLVEGHPEVMEIYADENSTYIAGEEWHSDVSCDEEPPLGTILRMIEVPPSGGDTLFSNMFAAFDALSEPMRNFLSGMNAVHDGEFYRGRYENRDDAGKTYPRAEHPIVRTHPVSGKQALFVNRIFTTRIVGLEKAESDALLQMLFKHAERPEFQCRFKWHPGSVAFWDNRCALHLALWDYYPNRRRGQRVTIKGERPL